MSCRRGPLVTTAKTRVTLKLIGSAWKVGHMVDANPEWMKYQQDRCRHTWLSSWPAPRSLLPSASLRMIWSGACHRRWFDARSLLVLPRPNTGPQSRTTTGPIRRGHLTVRRAHLTVRRGHLTVRATDWNCPRQRPVQKRFGRLCKSCRMRGMRFDENVRKLDRVW